MPKTILRLDLGVHQQEARQYMRDNPEVTLTDFLERYPALFPPDWQPVASDLERPVGQFMVQPVQLMAGSVCSTDLVARVERPLRTALDNLWHLELTGDLTPPATESPLPITQSSAQTESHSQLSPLPVQITLTTRPHPASLTDNQAVRLVYSQEITLIADYLKHGLSVLVICDKILTAFIYEVVCHQAGRKVVLDTTPPPQNRPGLGEQLNQALHGSTNFVDNLPALLHNLKQDEVFVLRALDLLNTPILTDLLYQRSQGGHNPQLLAFLDPSLEVRKVLTDRFAVHITLIGLPRYVTQAETKQDYAVSQLLTQRERARFADYDPEQLYKNVAGLNAIQFRNAMRYVGAKVSPATPARDIYQHIRQFKTASSDEIEIPDTAFDDIGGYDAVKEQLRQVITLIAGPVSGLSEALRRHLLPRGFVFHGPPGTGKTLFAKAIANEMNATIQMISGPEIMDKYVGQSESNLRHIFAVARRNAPAVIFFDEFDSLASQRSTYADGGARANNAVVAQLLTELDGFRHEQAVLVIGTTNRIDIIDEALLRPSRLRPLEISLPDLAARRQVAHIHAQKFGVDTLITNSEPWSNVLDQLATQTDGFNNDELRAIFQEVTLAYYLEGQTITPANLFAKAATIHQRRKEGLQVHLGT